MCAVNVVCDPTSHLAGVARNHEMCGTLNGRRGRAGHALTKQRISPLHVGMTRSTGARAQGRAVSALVIVDATADFVDHDDRA
jgi:hypothetical protein